MTHTYVYASGRLLRETFGDTTLDFFYSNSGQPYALSHNGTAYYYITNVQGDVMSIVDGTGAVVAEYEYDPYGNILSTTGTLADTLGQINPLRYRGYVYDQETELYYLQSRYYDPGIGRFLNADAFASTDQGILGHNMFAYCLNNPTKYADNCGLRPIQTLNTANTWGDFWEEVIEAWEKHANRNDEQDDYIEELRTQYETDTALIRYIENNWNKQRWYSNLYHVNPISSQGLDSFANVKYLSPDGQYEVVICYPNNKSAYIVTSSVNKGTRNYGTDGGIEHFVSDMLPYYFFGNSGYGNWGDVIIDVISLFV